MEEKNEGERDKVMKLATVNFSITKCPQKIYEAFTQFCQTETNDNYSMGLKALMEMAASNSKEIYFFTKLKEIEERLDELQSMFAALQQTPKPEIVEKKAKTFGASN